MSLPKNFEALPLSDLLTAQQQLAGLIAARREEAATEVRKSVERAADELGLSVRQLLNGTGNRRRRKDATTELS